MMAILKNSVCILMGIGLLAMIACARDATKTAPATDAKVALPKLVDLGAKGCIPCKKMAPILEELTTEYKGVFDIEFIDVWQPGNQEKAKAYGIQSIPTQIFLDARGEELTRHVGFLSKEDILKQWARLGYDFKPASRPEEPGGIKDPSGLAPVAEEVEKRSK